MSATNRLRILCLHGYKQYDAQFKNRTNSLRKALKNVVEFHYVTAPHKIPFDVHVKESKLLQKLEKKTDDNSNNDDESKQNDVNKNVNVKDLDYLPRARAWWRSSGDGAKYDGIEYTLEYISKIIKSDGPFDGILGFSQGGVLTTILCLMQKYPKYFEKTFNLSSDIIQQSANFKFAWIISGFLPRCHAIKPLLNDIMSVNNNDDESNEKEDKKKVIDNIPLLLVMGKTDQYVSTENVLNITNCFDKSNVKVVQHEGGHYVPSHKDVKQQYIDFLTKI